MGQYLVEELLEIVAENYRNLVEVRLRMLVDVLAPLVQWVLRTAQNYLLLHHQLLVLVGHRNHRYFLRQLQGLEETHNHQYLPLLQPELEGLHIHQYLLLQLQVPVVSHSRQYPLLLQQELVAIHSHLNH